MKLRLRLALTTIAVVIPVVLSLLWLERRAKEHAGEQALAYDTLVHMRSGGRTRCETAPATWGGVVQSPHVEADRLGLIQGPPLTLYGYDRALRSRNPAAPAIAPGLIESVRAGRDMAARRITLDDRPIVEELVRMPWADGPCAFVLARGPAAPRKRGPAEVPLRIWIVPLVIGFAAVVFAVGPVVSRIRRLTEAVKRSAVRGYEDVVDVGGRDEIADLARAFDDAGRQIRAQLAERERREQALREFLANTTHDMMIPLTVLQGHLAALKRAGTGGHIDTAAVTAAMDEAHYMASLMHNLAIVAKLDTDQPQVHHGRVDLNALVARVVARHLPIARQLEVTVDSALPEEPVVTEGDVTLLEQAVSNVVYNAIRHNRAHGHVAVILERDGGDRFRVQVVDDGPGMPAEHLARLGERGFRGDAARTRSPDGQGIGLHITSRVAELHGLSLRFGASSYGGLRVELGGPIAR